MFFIWILTLIPSLVLSQSSGDLRLVRYGNSTSDYYYGRLQIYAGGQWGEVCGDDFTKTEADVACHQLGFVSSSHSLNETYGNVSNVVLSEVYCPTTDYLHILRCTQKTGLHDCNINYVSLQCNQSHIWDNPYEGQLRLIGGNYTSEGLVFIYCNGAWGTICTLRSNDRNAPDVVCRQLGYTTATSVNHLTVSTNYSVPIWLHHYSCPSTKEVCLGACGTCSHAQPLLCTHYYDLTVKCGFESFHYTFGSNVSTCDYIEGGFKADRPRLGEVRLVNTTGNRNGIAEVVYYGSNSTKGWVKLCGSSLYDQNNALTICQQLFYSDLVSYSIIQSSNPTNQLYAKCSTKQPHILWCSREFTSCNTSLFVQCDTNGTYYSGQVRLVGGQYPSEGRLEIYFNGQWGRVTDSYYSNIVTEAESACRQLGYTGAISATVGGLPGTGPIWYYGPSCSTVQSCFTSCLRSSYTYFGIDGYQSDIAINCTFDTNATVTVGTSTLCEVDAPEQRTFTGQNIVTVMIVSIIVILVICGIVGTLCCCVCVILCVDRKAKRSRREGVQYSTQGQVYYTQGMVLVPVAPATQPQDDSNESEKEKAPLPPDDQ